MLNLFYAEPEADRWVAWDRYPRRVIRRLLRGPARLGGHGMVFRNLCLGLDRIGVPYRVNDFHHALRNKDEVIGIVGKPHLLDQHSWENPILFGAAVFSHPVEDPCLLERRPVRRVLVPGDWARQMFAESYGDAVMSWPVGIETDYWKPQAASGKDIDFLVYDKLRWVGPDTAALQAIIKEEMEARGLSAAWLTYGDYIEGEFHSLLGRSKAMVFLCEHETQGIAYQQALASGVPILALDRGGDWSDPAFFPHRIRYGPVTSVPYWDERCGLKFSSVREFPIKLDEFIARRAGFQPREYILENLTLEKCAQAYVGHYREISDCRRTAAAQPRPVLKP